MFYLFLYFLACQFTYSFDGNQGTFETYTISSYNRGIENAVNSSVEIHCHRDGDFAAKGSGNYLQKGKYKFILTASHVVSECDEIHILDRRQNTILANIKYSDEDRDVAIIVPVNKIIDMKPVSLKLETKKRILGSKVYFMGHPDDVRFFLFEGMVSMVTKKDLMLHSTAWGGTSGAVVFSSRGRVVGIAVAVKIVIDPITGIPRLFEDMVLVSRTDFLSRRFLKNVMDAE